MKSAEESRTFEEPDFSAMAAALGLNAPAPEVAAPWMNAAEQRISTEKLNVPEPEMQMKSAEESRVFEEPNFAEPATFSETAESIGLSDPALEEETEVLEVTAPWLEERRSVEEANYYEPAVKTADARVVKRIWDSPSQIILAGGSLRTWSDKSGKAERVQVIMKTEGRPLSANVELWNGPDSTPLKLTIFSEDGCVRPFSAVVETPRGHNTVALRNTGSMEFPIAALVYPGVKDVASILKEEGDPKLMQGGAVQTFPFDPSVSSVQILLQTGGRPLNARIELLQGPNSGKQVIDIFAEDGNERPFFAVIETPGSGNVVRIVNTGPVELPLTARVQTFLVDSSNGEETGGWDKGGAETFRLGGRK
jgi:hypothetical protein